jgi:transposase-like protein
MPNVTRISSPLDAKIPEACSNEAAAVQFLEEQRGWTTDDTATCPKCGVFGESRRMQAKDGSRNARFLWRCGACKAQFTVKVGTIMEDSPIKAQSLVSRVLPRCVERRKASAPYRFRARQD